MKTIRYAASASFDVETSIAVDDGTDDAAILSAIVDDLVDRYRLSISYEEDRSHA